MHSLPQASGASDALPPLLTGRAAEAPGKGRKQGKENSSSEAGALISKVDNQGGSVLEGEYVTLSLQHPKIQKRKVLSQLCFWHHMANGKWLVVLFFVNAVKYSIDRSYFTGWTGLPLV